jgi:hypothetical protein
MRTVGGWLLGVGLILGTAGSAAAQDAKDIIAKAIRAHAGSEAQLAQRKVCVSRSRGVLALFGGDTPTVRECSCVLPERVKWTGEFLPPGNKVPFTITLNGLRGWRMVFGDAKDMTPAEYDAVQDEAQFLWVCTLIPLNERSYTLTTLPEIKVTNRPAVGVKVESKGRGTVQLYFDKGTSLLVKGTFLSREAGVEMQKESFFSEYKDFNGLKQPTRQITLTNGKKTEDWTYESYRFPARIEEREFTKP